MKNWKINLYTIWAAQIFSLMSFGFGLPFLPFYMQELGVTSPNELKLYTGILTAAPAITMGIMAPIWGIVADKWGKKLMLLRAMLFGTLVLAGMGLATRVEHLIILRLAQGLFTGTVTASSALVASSTPSHRLSYALGFLSSSTFIGFSAGPAIGGFVAEILGYRTSFFIGAALLLLDFFLVLFIVKEDKQPLPSAIEQEKTHISWTSLLTLSLITMLMTLCFMRLSRTVFNPYLPLYIQELRSQLEGTVRITGIINGIIGLMTAASGLTLSRLGDKYNKFTVLIALLACGIILSSPLAFINSLLGFAILYGILFFAIGGIEPIIMSITSASVPTEKRGFLFGIQTLTGSIGWAIAPLLGSTISIKVSIQAIFVVIPICLFLALVAISFGKKMSEKTLTTNETIK